MQRILSLSLVLILLLGSLGCASKTETGAAVGAGTGAAAGALIGAATGNTVVGALIGAAVGGTAGAIIGNYMDRQAAELEADLEGATITRVGEGIKITFDSGLLFEVNKSDVNAVSQHNLANLAVILNKYDDTNVLIEGHTDADGTEEYNQKLSERRAVAVRSFLATQSVYAARMTTMGYGESQPVADNDSAAGKAQNRRVEVGIMANDKLKKAAEKQAGEG